MTQQSRSQPPQQSIAASFMSTFQQPLRACFVVFPLPFMGAGLSFTPPSVQAAPAPAGPTPSAAHAPAAASTTTTAAPPPATRAPAGAGLPAPLLAMLRDTEGPFLANEVFSTTPPEPLAPIEEEVPAPEWYAITRGRFVGVVDQFALSAVAISGVAHGARKAYTTQALALDAFNKALTWGGVQVA
ncbi:hypothetical protein B0H13DRAFT_2299717 [Mycena leptocephala]|nr:hypothetical protein B0H13DRAFT_2299717 [Mycena leptocephala]